MMFGRKVKRRESELDARRINQVWTFSSSGWLFVYFFGVIKCLREQDLHRRVVLLDCLLDGCKNKLVTRSTSGDEGKGCHPAGTYMSSGLPGAPVQVQTTLLSF